MESMAKLMRKCCDTARRTSIGHEYTGFIRFWEACTKASWTFSWTVLCFNPSVLKCLLRKFWKLNTKLGEIVDDKFSPFIVGIMLWLGRYNRCIDINPTKLLFAEDLGLSVEEINKRLFILSNDIPHHIKRFFFHTVILERLLHEIGNAMGFIICQTKAAQMVQCICEQRSFLMPRLFPFHKQFFADLRIWVIHHLIECLTSR